MTCHAHAFDAGEGGSFRISLRYEAPAVERLSTHVVVPLAPIPIMEKAARHPNPVFKIEKANVVMSTAELAGAPVRIPGETFHKDPDYFEVFP